MIFILKITTYCRVFNFEPVYVIQFLHFTCHCEFEDIWITPPSYDIPVFNPIKTFHLYFV